MKKEIVIYWSRRDFRLLDNPALWAAVEYAQSRKLDFLPMYILDSNIMKTPKSNIGTNRKKILARVLSQFSKNFKYYRIFCGKPVDILEKIAEEYNIQLFYNDDIEPYAISRDGEIDLKLNKSDTKTHVFKDQLSINVNTKSQSDTLYSVFTPFKNAVLSEFLNSNTKDLPDLKSLSYVIDFPLQLNNLQTDQTVNELEVSIFKQIQSKDDNVLFFADNSFDLTDWLSQANISTGFLCETEVLDNFGSFLDNKILNYKIGRDDLGLDVRNVKSTSRMSIALNWGLVSSRTLKQMILNKFTIDQVLTNQSISSFISELIWREFYKYILFHNPNCLNQEYQVKYRNNIQWVDTKTAINRFKSWICGETGYRIVDAAMYQIVSEGWMHNRTRMIVASVLTKNFGVDWRWGQEYFRLVLADLDEASNNGGWQWAGSVGADPKPIRIFNPYLQAEKFDPEGIYQLKWLPSDYSIKEPIIEHSQARSEAIKRYGFNSSKPKINTQDELF